MPPFLATYIEVTNENLLGECRILWGERERVAQWFGNVAEFEQGQNRFCQHHTTGKQRVAAAVFSQHHHDKMVLCRFVLFELPCFSRQFACFITYNFTHVEMYLCSLTVAAHPMLQQCRGRNVSVHPDFFMCVCYNY